MENRLIDTDLLDDISREELLNTINFPGIQAYVPTIRTVLETSERLASAVHDVLRGKTAVIPILPTELVAFNQQCRDLCLGLGSLESSSGVIPIHVIRIIREVQTTAMLIAQTPELFNDNVVQGLTATWGDSNG